MATKAIEVNLSQAIREALEAKGLEMKAADYRNYIIGKYPQHKTGVESTTFSTTLSKEKGKMKDSSASPKTVVTKSAKPAAKAAKVTASVGGGIADMLATLKNLVEQHGPEQVKKMVDVVAK